MVDRVGQFLGNYQLLRLLGRGAFAEVYLAEHRYLEVPAAIKVLHVRVELNTQEQFLREARTIAHLQHPHIVRVSDFGLQDQTPYLVMEYTPNGTLRERHPRGTRLSLEQIIHYVQQIAPAVDYAHQRRVIHRDIKPENLLLNANDEVVLSDFGIAVVQQSRDSLMTQNQAGTPVYMAPEQIQGKPTAASDQYALGVLVYEWLCGEPPFRGSLLEVLSQHLHEPPPSICDRVPSLSLAIEDAVFGALAKEPQARFVSMQDFADVLERTSHATSSWSLPFPSTASSHREKPQKTSQPMWKMPAFLTPLIGREQEVTNIGSLLLRPQVRLLTILGSGGIGKTRLAIETATQMRATFAHGVCFVELASISDPVLVIPTIARELGIQQHARLPLIKQVKTEIRERHLLLVLDNFEHVIAMAPIIEELLRACPFLKMGGGSRAVLRLQAEYLFPVPPLALPDLDDLPGYEALTQYAAVAFFVERAQAQLPTFRLSRANVRVVAEICVRLDGLPLPLELAAARIRLLPPRVLLARLSQRLTLLTGGAQTLPERQRTLRKTLLWSYDLLNAQEQRLFRWLSVFVGGCTLEAVEAISTALPDGADQVLEGVASLLDKSLLQQIEQQGGEPRLIMLETIREFGLESLAKNREMEAIRRAHANYYLALAEETEPKLEGVEQEKWLDRLERENDNLRAALNCLIDHQEAEAFLRLGAALEPFWTARSYENEGRQYLERILTMTAAIPISVRAKALNAAGELAFNHYDLDRAEELSQESLTHFRALGDKRGTARSLYRLGCVATMRGNPTQARSLMQEAMAFFREDHNEQDIAGILLTLASWDFNEGNYSQASSLGEESLAVFRQAGDKGNIATALFHLARVTFVQGDLMRSQALARESLMLSREVGFKVGIGRALFHLARVAFAQGDLTRSRSLAEESLALCRDVEEKAGIAYALSLLGQLDLYQGDDVTAYAFIEESLWLFKNEVEDRLGLGESLFHLARLTALQKDSARTRALYNESYAMARKMGNKLLIAMCLEGLASFAVEQGETASGVRLLGAAESLREGIEAVMTPIERDDYARLVEAAHIQMDELVFASAWAQGRSMKPEQAWAVQTSKGESISGGRSTTYSAKFPTSNPE